MTQDEFIYLQIRLNTHHPEQLREGLENWLQLGLIDHQQVKRICQTHLSSPLPNTINTVKAESAQDFIPEAIDVTTSSFPIYSPLFQRFSWQPWTNFQPAFSHLWTSFKEELSVRWLLFLGLFLVIVSSGVLAATQWQTFPNIGQYLILFSYTLSFLGVSRWAKRQENLQLTSKTLEIIALLLIPINLWAIDAFNLWNRPLSMGVAIFAASLLSFLYYHFCISRQNIGVIVNYLGLSYLHWGWSNPSIPLLFTYVGLLATAFILTALRIPKILPSSRRYSLDTPKGFVIYGVTVILLRAIFVTHLPPSSLGLAIALLGWLLQCHHPRLIADQISPTVTIFLEQIGGILLFLGWLETVSQTFPWQACLITLLALHFFSQRLQSRWLKGDVLALFIIVFQGCFLLWRLIPLTNRQEILEFAINISDSSTLPLSFLSVLFFPSIGLGIGFTHWLDQKSQVQLGNFSEKLSILLIFLNIVSSFVNPLWRSVVLLLSSVTFTYLLRYRSLKLIFVYFSHFLGLSGIISTIYWRFPDLSLTIWVCILLALMAIEWGLSIPRTFSQSSITKQTFYTSCWYFGFILSFIAYFFLWPTSERFIASNKQYPQGLLWLLTPITLTFVASQVKSRHKTRNIAFLSSYFAIIAQSLTLWQPHIRLSGLAIGMLLTFINAYFFRTPLAAKINIGFLITFISFCQLELFSGSLAHFTLSYQLLLNHTIIIAVLWLLYLSLKSRRTFLSRIYHKATDPWAVVLVLTVFIRLIFVQISFITANFNYLWICLALIILMTYRYWKKPSNLAVYTVAGFIELGILQGVELADKTILAVSIGNIMASLLILILFNRFLIYLPRFATLESLNLLPLLFGFLAILFRSGEFNAYTGLVSIGCGITGLGTVYRLAKRKSLTHLYLIVISLGIYECVIYQWSQSSQTIIHALLYLSLTSVAIAFIYYLFTQLKRRQRQSSLGYLRVTEIERIGHYYWGVAGVLKASSLLLMMTEKITLHPLVLLGTFCISIYGFLQGRNLRQQEDSWIYLGWIDVIITVIIARLIWSNLASFDQYWLMITPFIAVGVYYLPWTHLGWRKEPWKHSALILPLIVFAITLIVFSDLSKLSLLILAIFYLLITFTERNIRWSYLSLGFMNGLIAQFLDEANIKELIWPISLMGSTLIYIAQVDPTLQQPPHYKLRHYLQLTGSGIIALTALLFYQKTGLIPAGLGLLSIFAGLGFKIRAFLFVGTITFILTSVYQLLILSFKYAFLKWVIGLIVGIILITIAANFEQRKDQASSLWLSWQDTWNDWQ